VKKSHFEGCAEELKPSKCHLVTKNKTIENMKFLLWICLMILCKKNQANSVALVLAEFVNLF